MIVLAGWSGGGRRSGLDVCANARAGGAFSLWCVQQPPCFAVLSGLLLFLRAAQRLLPDKLRPACARLRISTFNPMHLE
jgi:hypothetical protein